MKLYHSSVRRRGRAVYMGYRHHFPRADEGVPVFASALEKRSLTLKRFRHSLYLVWVLFIEKKLNEDQKSSLNEDIIASYSNFSSYWAPPKKGE